MAAKRLAPLGCDGRFQWARRFFALLLLIVYVALPWIPVNGFPAVFLDVLNRHFHFMGPHARGAGSGWAFFGHAGLGFSLFFVILALFGPCGAGGSTTATIFLEHIYRRIGA